MSRSISYPQFIKLYLLFAAVMPVRESYYLAAVWAGMGAKWTFCLFLISYRYARIMRYTTPFLIINDTSSSA
jgi:hypothetical protein